MRKSIPLLLLIIISSCRNAWNEDNSKSFHKACVDEAQTWIMSPQKAATYCDCVIAKVKDKYPREDEAIKQISTLVNDKDLLACKDSVMKK